MCIRDRRWAGGIAITAGIAIITTIGTIIITDAAGKRQFAYVKSAGPFIAGLFSLQVYCHETGAIAACYLTVWIRRRSS